MNFKRLLKFLAITFGYGEFTSNEAYALGGYELLSPKLMSNRLARLYFMGFLKRKRIKRRIIARNGIECNKGYCYVYSLSSQGFKYLDYIGSNYNDLSDDSLDYDKKNDIVDDIYKKIIEDCMLADTMFTGSSHAVVIEFIKKKYLTEITIDSRIGIAEYLQLEAIIDSIKY